MIRWPVPSEPRGASSKTWCSPSPTRAELGALDRQLLTPARHRAGRLREGGRLRCPTVGLMARLRAWCASPLFRPTRARRRTSGSVVLDHEQGAFDAADFPQRRCQLVLARVRGVGLRVPGGRLGMIGRRSYSTSYIAWSICGVKRDVRKLRTNDGAGSTLGRQDWSVPVGFQGAVRGGPTRGRPATVGRRTPSLWDRGVHHHDPGRSRRRLPSVATDQTRPRCPRSALRARIRRRGRGACVWLTPHATS